MCSTFTCHFTGIPFSPPLPSPPHPPSHKFILSPSPPLFLLSPPPPPPAVNKAYKMLEEEEQLTYCREVVDEARALTEQKVLRNR